MPTAATTMNDAALWPDLDSPYALQPAQVDAFRRDGCIKLKQVLAPATLAHFGREITRLTIELNTERRPLAERSTYDRAFLQVMNLWEHSALVARFVMGQRLARIAAELLEVRGVRLYHDQSPLQGTRWRHHPGACRPGLLAAGQRPQHHRVDPAAGGARRDGPAGLLHRQPGRGLWP